MTFKGKIIWFIKENKKNNKEKEILNNNVLNKSEFNEKENENNTNNFVENNDEKTKKFSPIRQLLESPYNFEYNKINKCIENKSQNMKNNRMILDIVKYQNVDISRTDTIKVEIDNIDKDIQLLQDKLKMMIVKK